MTCLHQTLRLTQKCYKLPNSVTKSSAEIAPHATLAAQEPQTIEHPTTAERRSWSTFAASTKGQPGPNRAPRLKSEPTLMLGDGQPESRVHDFRS